MKNDKHIETLLAQAGHYVDPVTGAITPPIQSATTYARDENYQTLGDYSYARSANPTNAPLEKLIAQLEGGMDAKVFGSGMAGITAVLETVNAHEHIVAPKIMYHGTRDWLLRISERRSIGLTFFDSDEPKALEQAITDRTSLVWIETPTNPTWSLIDIEHSAAVAHEHGADLVVDSTVAPPVTSQPLTLGADFVFHSATKYYNGHSDVTAGIVATADQTTRWGDVCAVRTLQGGVLGSFESWLLLRGMRTLGVRYERASENALAIAAHLEHHPALEAVLYPGLPTHPGHQIAVRQMRNGFGGMLSLLVKGDFAETQAVANRMRVFVRATSLGGVESLVEHRAAIEGPNSPVAPNLLRLSVGLESVDDLIEDVTQALTS